MFCIQIELSARAELLEEEAAGHPLPDLSSLQQEGSAEVTSSSQPPGLIGMGSQTKYFRQTNTVSEASQGHLVPEPALPRAPSHSLPL